MRSGVLNSGSRDQCAHVNAVNVYELKALACMSYMV